MTAVNRVDRLINDEVSAAPGVHAHSQPRNMDRTPSAETHAWFLQGKGIFTGAFCLSGPANTQNAWEPDSAGMAPCLREGLAAMLVLSRKKNESIVINNDITVTVVEIRGDKVRLGIERRL